MNRVRFALALTAALLTLGAVGSKERAGSTSLSSLSGELPLRAAFAANFESPPVKPIAVDADGSVLYVANTPAGHLVVVDTANDQLVVRDEIAVGLDPVTVAVQPATARPTVWVANFLSDTVDVVDVEERMVTSVITVPDEPVNILFDPTGATAFVVSQVGTLTAIDTATRAVLSEVDLECLSPRAAVLNRGRVFVAALHSGNNTTTVGQEVTLELGDGRSSQTTTLAIAEAFSLTSGLFAGSGLAPWPTPPTNITEPSPRAERIIPDAGWPGLNEWLDILAVIDDGTGAPTQAAVDQLVADALEQGGIDLVNAQEVLQALLDDRWDTVDHDLAVVDVSDPTDMVVVSHVGDVGTTLSGMGVNPVTGELFVSNLEPRNLIRHEPNLNGNFVDHQIVRVQGPSPASVVAIDLHSEIPNFDDVSEINDAAREGSLAYPVDVVFRDDGARAYVAGFAVDRVGVLDPVGGGVLGRVDVGRGPRGLAIDSERSRLFVFNRTDLSISMLDISADVPVELAQLDLTNPEPESVREGRDFLYSAKFSRNFGSSCSMCHIDGSIDHLAWDLGRPAEELEPGPIDFEEPGTFAVNHPVKGPMLTMTLQGLDSHNPYHWRGDKPNFFGFNAAFADLLGGDELEAEEMDRFRRFVESILFPPTPFRDRTDSFVDPQAEGIETVFLAECDSCHNLAHDGANRAAGAEIDGGTIMPSSGPQIFLARQFRGLYKRLDSDLYSGFGLTHSGRMRRGETDNIFDPLFALFPGSFPGQQDIDNMTAFITAFHGDVHPIVGWQVLPEAPVSNAVREDLQLMSDLYMAGETGVLAHGFVAGERLSLKLETGIDGSAQFESLDGREFELDTLVDGIDAGDRLFFLAVPPQAAREVFVISGGDAEADQAVLDALADEGFSGTLGPEPGDWDSEETSLSEFDAVLLLNNHNRDGSSMLPLSANEIVNYVSSGGALVTGEWLAWNVDLGGSHRELEPVLPLSVTGLATSGETTTYSVVTENPVVGDGLPPSFAFSLSEIDGGVESVVSAKPRATVFYSSSNTGTPGLVGWNFGAGRVISFSTVIGEEELDNSEYTQLLGNSLDWAIKAD